MKKLIILASIALIAASCGSTSRVTTYTARTATLPYSIKATTMTSELQVSENKITAEVQNKDYARTQKEMEDAAVGEALNQSGADILLEPSYEYNKIDGKLFSVKVSGYPAKYSNFRPLTMEDVDIINKLKSPAKETLVIIKEKDTDKK